jgi:hypothetical protein
MFRLQKLTPALSRNSRGAVGGDGVPFGLFPHMYQGLERAPLSLTCRQGDFVDNLSEEGMQTKASGTS